MLYARAEEQTAPEYFEILANRNTQLTSTFSSRSSKFENLRVKFINRRQMADSHREEEQLNLLEDAPRGQQQQQNLKLG